MEANQRNARWTAEVLPSCRDGGDLSTWVLRETQGVGSFSKVGRQRGQPSSGRWRQENAAREAAERISALSGIGAGTSKSMAMAAGEDDADKFKAGGVLTCSASVQDSGEDRVTNTCGAYDVNYLKCAHGGVRAAAAAVP